MFTIAHNHPLTSRPSYCLRAIDQIPAGTPGSDSHHSDLRDYISDTTRSFRGMHAWRLTRFISR